MVESKYGPEPEHEEELRSVQRKKRNSIFAVLDWTLRLIEYAKQRDDEISEIEIAANLIETGGTSHNFGPKEAQPLFEALEQVKKAKKAGDN